MYILIKIPHVSKCSVLRYGSEAEFVAECKITAGTNIKNYSEAWEWFTHDLYGCVQLTSIADIKTAIQYPEGSHRWSEIRLLARELLQELQDLQPKRKAGRRPMPAQERNQKLMVTLPPHQVEYLRSKSNTSAYVSTLVEQAIKNEEMQAGE